MGTNPGFALLLLAAAASVPWLEDFERLKQHMSEAYANLEWVDASGRVELSGLARATEEELRGAQNAAAARRAIMRFLSTFRDPHLRGRKAPPLAPDRPRTAESGPTLDTTLAGSEACPRLGYRRGKHGFLFKLRELPGFEPLPADGNPFHGGRLVQEDGRRIGFLRIAGFDEKSYLDTAIAAWDRVRGTLGEQCDLRCQYGFRIQVRELLLAGLEQRIERLVADGIDLLAVDVSGNGGGTEWASVAPRLFLAEDMRCTHGAFVRHEHWTVQIERWLRLIDADLARPGVAAADLATLRAARALAEEQLRESRAPCDRSALWERPEAGLECSQLVEFSTCGLFDRRPESPLDNLPSRLILYTPLVYDRPSPATGVLLAVITDESTASAAELFAATLQANGASVVGQTTLGAGCGYTAGGLPLHLEHSGLLIRMPDCARYRADGENELAGIEPDVPIAWEAKESWRSRTVKLVHALSGLVPDLPATP